eukprot:ANDGO_07124.mRNA.1 hypothetical protein
MSRVSAVAILFTCVILASSSVSVLCNTDDQRSLPRAFIFSRDSATSSSVQPQSESEWLPFVPSYHGYSHNDVLVMLSHVAEDSGSVSSSSPSSSSSRLASLYSLSASSRNQQKQKVMLITHSHEISRDEVAAVFSHVRPATKSSEVELNMPFSLQIQTSLLSDRVVRVNVDSFESLKNAVERNIAEQQDFVVAVAPMNLLAASASCPAAPLDINDFKNCYYDTETCETLCIYITPAILEGLIVGGVILLLSLFAFSMLSAVQTPERFEGEVDSERKNR